MTDGGGLAAGALGRSTGVLSEDGETRPSKLRSQRRTELTPTDAELIGTGPSSSPFDAKHLAGHDASEPTEWAPARTKMTAKYRAQRPRLSKTAELNSLSMRRLTFHDVNQDRWPDFERLFESRGSPKSCWCMVWRARGEETRRIKGPDRKQAMDLPGPGGRPGRPARLSGRFARRMVLRRAASNIPSPRRTGAPGGTGRQGLVARLLLHHASHSGRGHDHATHSGGRRARPL
jgi:hypothetical protein